MLKLVRVKKRSIKEYEKIVGKRAITKIKKLAAGLKKKRVIHINATPVGGGVAEILKNLVPLMKSCGIKTRWYSLHGHYQNFFNVTKEFHNALQGKDATLSDREKLIYLSTIEKIATSLPLRKADFWIIHDPQVLALIDYLPHGQPAIWRMHIDTSAPNPEFWQFILPFIQKYDKVIFSLKDYIHNSINGRRVRVIPPAIDPVVDKNTPMPLKEARRMVEKFGVDSKRPLIIQVSRFDPWKDPQGVVKAYKLAKKKIPALQLAYLGLKIAKDDPEAEIIYRKTKRLAGKDKDIHLFFDPNILDGYPVSEFVRAHQSAADIILQKSTREGFGLTVTEAMWKSKPIIGGNVGGIRLQIRNRYNGYLVNSISECAQKIIYLLNNSKLRNKIGKKAKKSVKENYLITRLLKDYLTVLSDLNKK